MAELRVELEGEYAGAVRVYVSGVRLGSIPHDETEAFRAVLRELHEAGLPATCHASLDAGEWVDVWLYAAPERRQEGEPFLPPKVGVRVVLDAGVAERLDTSIRSRAKRKTDRRMGELRMRDDTWRLAIEGEEAGALPAGVYQRLEEALRARCPLTCTARLIREPGKPLRVMADVP